MSIKDLKIYLFYGAKGSGKSLFMARLAQRLFNEYYRTERRYPQLPKRKLYSNQKYSKKIEEQELGKHLQYWTHPEQLYWIRDSDILWDEVGKDLPAGSWQDTSKELKQVFSHLRKRGNRLFANTQQYKDIDISFRRQTDIAWQIQKLFGSRDISVTLPPPKIIYGIIYLRQFDPLQIEYIRDPEKREKLEIKGIPHILIMQKKYIEMYDTTAELPPYQPNKLKELILTCREGENCSHKDKYGNPYKVVRHNPV